MRFFTLLLTFIFVLSSYQTTFAEDSLYERARTYFEEAGILSEDIDRDDQKIVKVEFLKIIMENTGYSPNPKLHLTPTPYKDVDPRAWYAPYVQNAYRVGLEEKKEYFNPTQKVRKIDALKIILELEGYTIPRVHEKVNYRDLRTAEERRIAAKVLELGVYQPESEKWFGAQMFITKKDAIELVYKFHLISEADAAIMNQGIPTVQIEIEGQRSTLPNIDYLESVRDQIFSKYYKSTEVKESDLMDSAIQGFVEGLGDTYSVYFPAQDANDFSDSLEGTYEGIGAYLEETVDGIIIQTPIKGSPAEKAGVMSGDIIKKVDEKDIEGMQIKDVVKRIKGPSGTPVIIEFERNGDPITIRIIRGTIELKSVSAELKDNVLVITMNQFSANTAQEFSDIISQYDVQSYSGVILDLRSNPGGFLSVAEEILSYWIPEDTSIVQLQYKTYKTTKLAIANQQLVDVKTAILVNKASASASEIVAGTLQDYDRAEIFGETTFGKGTVQELIQYQNGATLKLTIAEWLTGKGNSINGSGVGPDQKVEDDPETEQDEVLEKAIEWVKNN